MQRLNGKRLQPKNSVPVSWAFIRDSSQGGITGESLEKHSLRDFWAYLKVTARKIESRIYLPNQQRQYMKVRLPGFEYHFCHLVTRDKDKCFHVLMPHFPPTKGEH